MKLKLNTTIGLTTLLLSQAAWAEIQINSDTWSINRSVTLDGSQAVQNIIDSAETTVTVGKYSGSNEITRVVIKLERPLAGQPSAVTGIIGIKDQSGTVNFSSVSGRLQNSVSAGQALSSGIEEITGEAPNTRTHTSLDSKSNQTITDSETISVGMNYGGSLVLWDSDNYPSITSVQLEALFKGTGGFLFDVESSVRFGFNRDNTESITMTTSGVDTGRVIIEYHAIPEPQTYAALMGVSVLLLMAYRRRARK